LHLGVRIGDLQLESRMHFSASRWTAEALWMMPFITTCKGTIGWVSIGAATIPKTSHSLNKIEVRVGAASP
jgi:hypothetical protein